MFLLQKKQLWIKNKSLTVFPAAARNNKKLDFHKTGLHQQKHHEQPFIDISVHLSLSLLFPAKYLLQFIKFLRSYVDCAHIFICKILTVVSATEC